MTMMSAQVQATSPLIPLRSYASRNHHTSLPFVNHLDLGSHHFLTSSSLLSIRGGADLAMEESETESESEDESSEDEATITEETESDEEEEESEDESEEEEEEEESTETSPAHGPPIKVNIRTNLNVPLIDQHLEFTASQKRDVESLKLSISRQMLGRPPVSSQTLLLGTRVLNDDELVADLLEEWEEEHHVEDEDKDELEHDEETTLHLVLDIPPPVDPKFATELKNALKKTNLSELLDAYVSNMAMLHRNTERMFQQLQEEKARSSITNEEGEGDESEEHEDVDEEDIEASSATTTLPESMILRDHAQMLREQLMSTFSEEILQKIQEQIEKSQSSNKDEEEDNDKTIEQVNSRTKGTEVYLGSGLGSPESEGKSAMRGGAKMTVKRALQRNLNIVSATLMFKECPYFFKVTLVFH